MICYQTMRTWFGYRLYGLELKVHKKWAAIEFYSIVDSYSQCRIMKCGDSILSRLSTKSANVRIESLSCKTCVILSIVKLSYRIIY